MITTRDVRVTNVLARRREQRLTEAHQRKYRAVAPASLALPEGFFDGAWAGQACFIIGGGPSLKGFDFNRLRGRGRIIAINRAYEFVPFADVHYFMDRPYYKRIQSEPSWRVFPGIKVYLNMSGYSIEGGVVSLRPMGRTGLSRSLAEGIYHGNNSGVGAIGLAHCLGANPVYLLGYDCKRTSESSHFHSGYGRSMSDTVLARMIKDFDDMAALLRGVGTRVINLNPDSAIRCFPISTFDALED
jgi:hypothetical protein